MGSELVCRHQRTDDWISRSFVDDGMWDMVSAAKTNNLPLSKEMFLQTQGQAQDCWEDELYADDDHDAEADNSSEEDN